MLIEIKVTDFAIIDQLNLQFRSGLNILSGETGAGKTVLLKSLGLLMGMKSASDMIRTGSSSATVEGLFDLSHRRDILRKLHDLDIPSEENTLVVRRILTADKSRVYLNGALSTVQILRDIVAPLLEIAGGSAPLIEMTGQHENRHLLSTQYQLDLVDQYGNLWELRNEVHNLFEQIRNWYEQIAKLDRDMETAHGRRDYLIFQRDEIKQFGPKADEEAALEASIRKLKSADRILRFAENTQIALSSGDANLTQTLHTLLHSGHELLASEPALKAILDLLREAKVLIEDASYQLQNLQQNLQPMATSSDDSQSDPLDDLESRLSQLRKLQKKYGAGADSILLQLNNIEVEIGRLDGLQSEKDSLLKKIEATQTQLTRLAQSLSGKRKAACSTLVEKVNAELLDLNMKGVHFSIELRTKPEVGVTGLDELEFVSQTSKNEPGRSLAKFSSGGELSRILLALKTSIGASRYPRTFLFDEVDTGVSGPTAEKVGKKLKSIARGQQVICVTHLPQVAACGDHHFFIQKNPMRNKTQMQVIELKKSERVNEIARLISGEKISKSSLDHAQHLLTEGASL